MNPLRLSLVAFLAATAAAYGQPEPETRSDDAGPALTADSADQTLEPRDAAGANSDRNREPAPDRVVDPEWERAHEDFIRARAEFSAMTAAALTSDELVRWASGLTNRVRLSRAEQDLRDAHEGMRAIEASGRGGTEAAERQAARIAAAEDALARLRDAQAAGGAGIAVEGLPDRETIRRWMQAQMAEETLRLADTLDTRELERRTRRLRRLTALAGMAGQLRRTNREPAGVEIQLSPGAPEGELGPAVPVESELGPAGPVVPAGGETETSVNVIVPVEGQIGSGESGLGEPTAEPPALPSRVSLRKTSGKAPAETSSAPETRK